MKTFRCLWFTGATRAVAVAFLAIGAFSALGPAAARAGVADDEKAVAALDTRYQAAVAKNDAAGMERILADDFVLVTGRGKAFNKADLLREARGATTVYERQEEEAGSQKVRVWGDTAVVTALLWIKGTREGKAIEYKLWFSDTYVRTPSRLAVCLRPGFHPAARRKLTRPMM